MAAATIPAALIALLVLCVNWSKFGSPWLTGYHQWRPEIHRWNGQFSDGVVGFLLDPQRSVFLYFPPLVGALLAFKTFARRHAFEATLIAVTFLIFLIALGMLPSWRGERSYGPRYLMFLLPVASVPCLALPEWARTWSSHARLFGRAAIALVLGLSVWLQLQVNRLDFFAFYQVRDPIQSVLSDDARAYLANTPFGSINYDLVRYSDHPENLPYVRSLMESSMDDPAKASYLATLSQVAAQRNYLWPFMRGP